MVDYEVRCVGRLDREWNSVTSPSGRGVCARPYVVKMVDSQGGSLGVPEWGWKICDKVKRWRCARPCVVKVVDDEVRGVGVPDRGRKSLNIALAAGSISFTAIFFFSSNPYCSFEDDFWLRWRVFICQRSAWKEGRAHCSCL